MKKLLLATAATAAIGAPMVAVAQAPAAPAATPEHTVTGNMAIVSDYRFRGISQTFGEGFLTSGRRSRAGSTTRIRAASISATGTPT